MPVRSDLWHQAANIEDTEDAMETDIVKPMPYTKPESPCGAWDIQVEGYPGTPEEEGGELLDGNRFCVQPEVKRRALEAGLRWPTCPKRKGIPGWCPLPKEAI